MGVFRTVSNIYERVFVDVWQGPKYISEFIYLSKGQFWTPWRARKSPWNFLDLSYSELIDYTLILGVREIQN